MPIATVIAVNVLFWPFIYLLAGVAVRLAPETIYQPGRRLFRELGFETRGRAYIRLCVEDWSPLLAPLVWLGGYRKKHFYQAVTIRNANRFCRDACVMECFHWLAALLGFACLIFTPAVAAAILCAVNALVNLAGVLCMRCFRVRFRKIKELLVHAEELKMDQAVREIEEKEKGLEEQYMHMYDHDREQKQKQEKQEREQRQAKEQEREQEKEREKESEIV